MNDINKKDLLERFLKYVSFETTSDPNSGLHPSSEKEWDLIKYLKGEIEGLGLSNIYMNDHAYVYGCLKANAEGYKSVGFNAHVDTSCDAIGKDIKTQIHENYDGNDLVINKELNKILSVNEYPFMKHIKGETLITTDGTTLLGADDKAGIAEIVTAVDYLIKHPEIKHGDVWVAFTPDEEIGEGTDFFDLDKFPCEYAYTMDGGEVGELNYECFNAASAVVSVKGFNIHPGSAKDHMKNSIKIAYEFNSLLDPMAVPEHTEKYEGFNHLNNIEGTVEETKLHYIIRNHDMAKFNAQKEDFKRFAKVINDKYGEGTVTLDIRDSYMNMYEYIKDKNWVVEKAIKAINDAGIKEDVRPIRGGTDGARLSQLGLPTPNLGTGGYNFHGNFEFASLDQMAKGVEVILNIIKTK